MNIYTLRAHTFLLYSGARRPTRKKAIRRDAEIPEIVAQTLWRGVLVIPHKMISSYIPDHCTPLRILWQTILGEEPYWA